MIYLNWNIKCHCEVDKIIDLLSQKITKENCIIGLQEVMPANAIKIEEKFQNNFHILYSLNFRQPSELFDRDNRRLGVMLLISKNFELLDSNVISRALFPDRTLYAKVKYNNNEIKVLCAHSLTGVGYKMAKSCQFLSLAEFINEYNPDIVSIDANEPQEDHYEISRMKFFDQGDKGKGAKTFFEEIEKNNLIDSFAIFYDKTLFIPGQPLTTSHIINNNIKRRYDFVFLNKKFNLNKSIYHLEESIQASSDHALIKTDFDY